MNNTIKHLPNGDFEVEKKEDKGVCECVIPEPRGKCSENGILTYCSKCLRDYRVR